MSNELRCPGCGEGLTIVDAPELAVHRCTACGGAWLDNAAAGVLIALRVGKPISEAARAALMEAPSGGPPPAGSYRAPADTAKKCAVCGSALLAHTPPGMPVELDVCAEHGTWFDATELRACAQAMEMAALRSDDAFEEDIAAIERSRAWGDDPILAALSGRGWLSRLLGGS